MANLKMNVEEVDLLSKEDVKKIYATIDAGIFSGLLHTDVMREKIKAEILKEQNIVCNGRILIVGGPSL